MPDLFENHIVGFPTRRLNYNHQVTVLLSFSSSSNKPLSGLNFLSQAFWSLFGTKLFCHNINLSEDLGSYKDSLHSVDVDQNLVNSG